MALYMTQFSYTQKAWSDLVRSPEDRRPGIAALLERMGGRLVEIYYSMGDHDGFIIYESPDSEAAAAGIVAALSAGHLRVTRTVPLFSMEEMLDVLAKAGGESYAPPHG